MWAKGESFDILEKILDSKASMGEALNRKLMRDFRVYMAVGGMPQAVNAYLAGKNFEEIDRIKREIISLYMDDFRKIDKSGRIGKLYEGIPSQLSNNKTRFVISSVLNKKTTSKDLELLYELIDSKTVIPAYNVNEPAASLSLTKDLDKFKLYLADVGLFVTMLFNDRKLKDENIYNKLLSDKLPANLGYLYENAVANMIRSSGRELYFHTWYDEVTKNLYEIDFLAPDGAKICPIEVKSSNVRTHKSIDLVCKKYSKDVSKSFLFSQKDVSKDGALELKPIYLAPLVIKSLR